MEQFEKQKDLSPESSSAYLLEGEGVGAKLFIQHRYLSELMGGILPPLLEPSWGSDVLAIGWCVAGLVFEMALRYPSFQITGIDKDVSVVAQAQTMVRRLGNAAIIVQDINQLNDRVFSSASFDLIYLRFLLGDVMLEQFPLLMQSLARICRTRGLLVWTETELPITTSPACQQLCAMIRQALQASGDAFAPGNSTWVTAYMDRWLIDAGFRIAQSKTYALDVSTGSKGHDTFVRQVLISGEQVRSFLLEKRITTVEGFAKVFGEIQHDIQQENFYGIVYLKTFVGVKL
jgi:ubiquinone/menaquinone biosynthesis C-methylase UbiE